MHEVSLPTRLELQARLRSALPWLVVLSGCYLVGLFIPEGFDWVHYFSLGLVHPVWTPWTKTILGFLNWPLVVAVTLFSIILRSYRYNPSPWPIMLAVLSLPTLWVIFMGNLDGLVLLGLCFLPWAVPLATMKPQVAAFALLAKKSYILAGIAWGLLTLILYGLWPRNFLMVLAPEWRIEWVQDISLFPWGLLVAIPLLWLSRGDEDLLMIAGSFATPHLFPYHYILVMPALGRMRPIWMVLCWLISWSPLIANWIGPLGWRMGNILGVLLWLGIYFSKRNQPTPLPGQSQDTLGATA